MGATELANPGILGPDSRAPLCLDALCLDAFSPGIVEGLQLYLDRIALPGQFYLPTGRVKPVGSDAVSVVYITQSERFIYAMAPSPGCGGADELPVAIDRFLVIDHRSGRTIIKKSQSHHSLLRSRVFPAQVLK